MMYINKLKLLNYRNFESLEISFEKDVTVLVGNNGAGKSTILSAAVVALSTMFQSFDTSSAVSITERDARRKKYDIGEQEDNQALYPVSITAQAMVESGLLTWTRSLNSQKGKTTIVDAKEMLALSLNYRERVKNGDQTLVLPVMLYYGTDRLFDYHRKKRTDVFKTDNRLNGYIDSLDSSANIKSLLNWFKKKTIEKYQRIERNDKPDPALDIVYRAMEENYRQVSGLTSVKIQFNLSRNELDIWYTEKNGKTVNLPISQLSDGYRTVISLVADVAYRMTILNPNLGEAVLRETPGIVLIDEVDQHLHPQWQKRIINDLRSLFPQVQFIVTTHAPSVINTVKTRNMRILDNYQIDNIGIEVYGRDSNSIIRSVMKGEERPAEIMEKFKAFYDLLSKEEYQKAEKCLNAIEEEIGDNDPELVSCRYKLSLYQ